MSRTEWRYVLKTALIACALLLVGDQVKAQDSGSATPSGAKQGVYQPDVSPYPYPDEGQPEYGPTDADTLLNSTAPRRGSIFGDVVPEKYFQWKQNLYTKYGLKLGLFSQMAFMYASDTAPFSTHNTAYGGWFGFDAKWTPLNRGEAYEGSLVLVSAWRGSIGNNAVPAQLGVSDLGSGYSVNFGFTEWDFAIEELYWEQWFGKNRLMFRIGNTAAGTMISPFRFKDDRTSFTQTPFAFHESMPSPAQGPGFALKWWPIEDSEFYVTGVLNDVNGNPADGTAGLDWGSFAKGEYFYAIEFGYIWRRAGGEYDRLFLDIFYNAERSTRDPALPNEAGGGFKILGSKQWGQWVGFGSYTFNTAEGGSTGVTFGKHTITAGAEYLAPFGIQGEVGTGLVWLQTFPDLELAGVDVGGKNQYGLEAYWKILMTPNLWVTPGLVFMFDPVFNSDTDFIAMPGIKFRLAY